MPDFARMFYSRLSPRIQQSRDGKSILEKIQKAASLTTGKTAPDFTLNNALGKKVSLNDFRGKYVLLDFWASWCVPCREEAPLLVKIYHRYQDKNFAMIGISIDALRARKAWLSAIAIA